MTTPSLNPALTGFQCLRCDAVFPIAELFEGCTRCAADGHASSVVATYRGTGGDPAARLPILGVPTLGEGDTPLLSLDAVAEALGLAAVWLKAEGRNPTGSHKDRMSPLVVARAAMLGHRRVVAASSGNGGVSLAAYTARAGLACTILIREGIPGRWARDMTALGAEVVIVKTAAERWQRMAVIVRRGDAYPATNYLTPPVGSNPFGVQGYKRVGHEIARDLDVTTVDTILVPAARGDLLWGLWAGLCEAVPGPKPSMVAVEPFPRLSLVLAGTDYRATFPGTSDQYAIANTAVTWQSLHALRASGGCAAEVNDLEAHAAQRELWSRGIELEGCSAAPLVALRRLRAKGVIPKGGRAILVGTSDGRREARRP